MGLFDSVAGAVLGKVMGGNQGGMAAIAMELLNSNGGIGGLLSKFQAGGLGDAAASWVGKGSNLPVSADQVTSALGSGQLAEIAAKFGISPEVLSGQLAEHLPSVIDKATPDGEVNAGSSDILSSILGMLK
ncbi:MAG: YidB family protein [Methylophilaceae bacterium]